ncbi:putative distant relative of homeotic protein bithoraxoid [Pyrobaculum oguniense TE7]|uniref:Distant relative of homeotic protein bithoraxoid n=1 Tax=Pyrobaculum oguniense (strain DSM 13380 / JCM 10595 / TE7) TaxID=698757 RepID=H6QCI5_PYROT|nr:putative distant relative of homeotic protein bithoraxoid [Pyrobaculum oguniense TE7]
MSLESRYKEELSTFLSRVGGDVQAVVLARRDGLPVAHISPGMDAKTVAALTALALGSLKRVGEELKIGSVRNFIAYYENRVLLAWPAKDLYVIAVASPDANLGLIMLELERLAKRLAGI